MLGGVVRRRLTGYVQIGLYKGYAYRSGHWLDDWTGEVFPERVFTRP
ncbi:MAG: hypothetical protein HYU87_11475 [Chloroflexi bacterium]|nr:hypothetical protein [Chloroflexota bacterium]